MADGDEPIRPKPAVPRPTPGQPLPRIWKTEPEEDEDETQGRDRRSRRDREKAEKEEAEAEAKAEKARAREREKSRPAPKSKPAAKAGAKAKAGEKKGVLVEETPELDTYESRQRVRLLLGAVLGIVAIGGIIVGLQSLGGQSLDESDIPEDGGGPINGPPPVLPVAAKLDIEAKNLLATAKQLARNGKTDAAVAALKTITKSHPNTPAASEAKTALARPDANLPLFLDEPAVVATPRPGATGTADAGPEVRAVEPRTGAIRPGATADARLDLPPNPAEPARAPAPRSTASKDTPARPLPSGFRPDPDVGVHSSGWPLQIVSDRDGSTMCLVPVGTFSLGRDDGAPDEGPEHRVKLGAFYIDQHEVTNRQYAIHLRETGRRPAPRSAAKKEAPTAPGEDLPAVNVSWNEAKAYCDWSGKSLPTEAQWEAAARTTDGRLFPWGSAPPTWSRPRAPRQIDPVMSYELDQTPYSTFDLAGNAWEWTRDWFDSKYYQTLKSSIVENPTGPPTSRARPPQMVVKGGSKLWNVAWREGLRPETKLPYVGFRGVLPVETTTAGPGGAPPNAAPSSNTVPPANASGVVPF